MQEQNEKADPLKVERRGESQNRVGKHVVQEHVCPVVLVKTQQENERDPTEGQLGLVKVPDRGRKTANAANKERPVSKMPDESQTPDGKDRVTRQIPAVFVANSVRANYKADGKTDKEKDHGKK